MMITPKMHVTSLQPQEEPERCTSRNHYVNSSCITLYTCILKPSTRDIASLVYPMPYIYNVHYILSSWLMHSCNPFT